MHHSIDIHISLIDISFSVERGLSYIFNEKFGDVDFYCYLCALKLSKNKKR